jgi:hypothetical protein
MNTEVAGGELQQIPKSAPKLLGTSKYFTPNVPAALALVLTAAAAKSAPAAKANDFKFIVKIPIPRTRLVMN